MVRVEIPAPFPMKEQTMRFCLKYIFFAVTLLLAGSAALAQSRILHVSASDPAAYHTLQAAIDAAPPSGTDIILAPGIYREKIHASTNGIHIRGTGARPEDTVIVYDDGAITAGGTFRSATLQSSGDDFRLDNLTVQNAYARNPVNPPSQAVALAVTGDRNVFTHVRLLGAQDTLYANKGAGGRMSRQYFSDCYIEGHVDFIFGNAKAYFQNCELHGIAHTSVMYTAQSKASPDEDSAYVFDNCRLTADKNAQNISLGRAWRPYATVIFLRARMDAPVIPEGWREWTPGKTDTLKTAYYAEYHSTGIGASPKTRVTYAHTLSDAQADQWSVKVFFKGDTDWLPPQYQPSR